MEEQEITAEYVGKYIEKLKKLNETVPEYTSKEGKIILFLAEKLDEIINQQLGELFK